MLRTFDNTFRKSMLLMAEILRITSWGWWLVVYPMFFFGFYTSQVVQEVSHQQCHFHDPIQASCDWSSWNSWVPRTWNLRKSLEIPPLQRLWLQSWSGDIGCSWGSGSHFVDRAYGLWLYCQSPSPMAVFKWRFFFFSTCVFFWKSPSIRKKKGSQFDVFLFCLWWLQILYWSGLLFHWGDGKPWIGLFSLLHLYYLACYLVSLCILHVICSTKDTPNIPSISTWLIMSRFFYT